MTAVPDWDIVDPRTTDAELVRGSMAGDRAAFAQIYDRYADRLHDFCVGMLRDFDGAADCVQETFCVAATRLHQLREPDKLRPWLYSVARNEALRRLRDRRRETPSDDLPEIESDDAGPDTLSARTELADLVAEVAGGLSDRDQAVLDLAFRHGLSGPDLADALGVSHANANTLVMRLRRTVERSLGALLVSRRARTDPAACAELREIISDWDGEFTILVRKRVSRHIESCPVCDDERRRLVSPAALLGAAPVFIPAPEWLRERTLGEVQLTSASSTMGGDSSGSPVGQAGASHIDRAGGRRRMLLAAVFVAMFAASTGLLLAWMNRAPESVVQTEISETMPGPTMPGPTMPIKPPPQAPAQTPGPVTPRSNVPPPGPPPVQTFEPGPEAPPQEGALEDLQLPPANGPSSKPPMSFAPTVVAPPPPQADAGDGDAGSRRAGSAGAP